MPPESLLAQWREVNHRANELERKLFEASLQYTRGAGPKPTPQQWEEAQRTREYALELFRRAMSEFDDTAAAARIGISTKSRGSDGSSEGGGSPVHG